MTVLPERAKYQNGKYTRNMNVLPERAKYPNRKHTRDMNVLPEHGKTSTGTTRLTANVQTYKIEWCRIGDLIPGRNKNTNNTEDN